VSHIEEDLFDHFIELLYLTVTFLHTKELLKSIDIDILKIPPNWPDLNPIETFFATMANAGHKKA